MQSACCTILFRHSFRLLSLSSRSCLAPPLPTANCCSSALRMSTATAKAERDEDPVPADMQLVKEGSANVAVPCDVFYNPVQVFNRDLTVAVLNVFGEQYLGELAARRQAWAARQEQQEQKQQEQEQQQPAGLRILEALAATGLRSIRLAKEVSNVAKVVANDNSAEAVRLIGANSTRNGVGHLVEASHNDAVLLGHQCARLPPEERFDVVDLDPYGSAVPFLDSAVQAVRPGGLLCVTCTDTAVLCGSAFGTCYGRYGGVPYRGAGMHEASLRILLQCVQSHASRHGRYIEPLLSLSVDFYVRIYLRVHRGQGEVKRIGRKLAMLHYCPACDTHALQPLSELGQDKAGQPLVRPSKLVTLHSGGPDGRCGQCGIGRPQLAGPMWSAAIHSTEFIRRLVAFVRSSEANGRRLASAERLVGLLSVTAEELPDAPLFYSLDDLAKTVKCRTMPMRLARSALLNAGYRVSISHCEGTAIKTDAPADFLWDLVRAYRDQFSIPVAERHLQAEGSVARALLVDRRQRSAAPVDFTLHPDAEPASKADGLLRFHVPPPNWGPKPRAKRRADETAASAADVKGDGDADASPTVGGEDGETAKKCKNST